MSRLRQPRTVGRFASLGGAFVALVAVLFVDAAFFTAAAQGVDVDPEVLAAEAARVAVMAEAHSKTVAIFPPEGNGGGSGVLISPDGYALSNFHVVHGSEKHMKCGLADGRSYDAVVVSIDPVGDVALIKLLRPRGFSIRRIGRQRSGARRRLGVRFR
ncbi:MAG: trypsin-like peptidase domain-containing protein [Pirellulales bacterium]